MCGIFALLNNNNTFQSKFIEEQFLKGHKRGPENSRLMNMSIKTIFGFHRLAINGLNKESNQPIIINNISLICNGEIYNYKELYKLMNVKPQTDSDCEVIIHLYEAYGMEQTLQMLDGVFSFVLYDTKVNTLSSNLYIARDPYGVRPLYQLVPFVFDTNVKENVMAVASELKVLQDFYNTLNQTHTIQQFLPGTYSYFTMPFQVSPEWEPQFQNRRYHSQGFTSIMFPREEKVNTILYQIQSHFIDAVRKRVLTTDRPIACLLSGGLDSSLVTALVNEIHSENSDVPLETYSIGLKGSEDLKYARQVAEYLGTNHTSIELSEEDFFNAIPEVIQVIESYDTTTVRASIGNYLVAKYIKKNSQAKVIFNGDGADELFGGYLYLHAAPNALEFDKETRRLLTDIHIFDVLRSDKSISSNGLEPRTPFLDRTFVQFYLSLHPSIRYHKGQGNCEKYLIREAFNHDKFLNKLGQPILPSHILWRTKEAFSDGVSSGTRSLYEIIRDFVKIEMSFENADTILALKRLHHNPPDTEEKMYYRKIYESYYPNTSHLVPYFWMPKYVKATDASARTLSLYHAIMNNEEETKVVHP